MKRIIVTLTEEYLLPDDWEILAHPEDHLLCLRGEDQYFMPVLEWMERLPPDSAHASDAPLKACWEMVDEDRDDWFMEQNVTGDTEIRHAE